MTLQRLLPLLLLAGCVFGRDAYDRPADLPPSWQIDRLRLLAVRPEPPEALPGETVTFEALIADPDEVVQTVVWVACPPSGAGDFGCNPDLSAIPENPTPEDLEELGVIGIQPFYEPVYEVPDDLLDDLDEQERERGLNVTVQVLALPAMEDTGDLDFNEVEAGFKRLVVSEARTPNHNPEVAEFVIDDTPIPEGVTVEIDRDREYRVGLRLTDESVEEYQFFNRDDEWEDRVEEPYVTLYASDGGMNDPFALLQPGEDPLLQGRWQSPDRSGAEGLLFAVARDRRGGMTWAVRTYLVR